MTEPGAGDRDARAVLRLLLGGRRDLVIALVASSLACGLLESFILVLVAQVAAALVDGGTRLNADLGPAHVSVGVGAALAVAFACAVARLALQVAVAYLPARIAADVEARLRERLFGSFSRAAWRVQAEEREGGLQELLGRQVVEAGHGALYACGAVTAGVGFVALLASAVLLSPLVALLVVGVAGVLSLALRPLNRLGSRHARELSSAGLDLADGVSQAVRLAEETQAFGTGAVQRRQVGSLVGAARAAFFRAQFVGRLAHYTYQGLAVIAIVGGLAGLYWSDTGRVAVLGAVVLMLVRSATYAQQAHGNYHMVRQAAPFLERVQAAEARYTADAPVPGTRPIDRVRALACDGLCFAYPGRANALDDVSFEVLAGEAVGIVGPSGAGKSTLAQILLGLREPTAGAYRVNGRPPSDFVPGDWHRLVAYVPQDPQLLHGTVAENIRFFRDIDDEAVEQAARLAHIHDDVVALPAGYATVVGQRAAAVSGGQRQRLCLARALAAAPDVLVLDEPTSALDLRSEALIHESLAGLRGRLTLFVVSHRLSTLAVCDQVVVMASGRVEGFGPARELERSNAFFRGAVAFTARSSGSAAS